MRQQVYDAIVIGAGGMGSAAAYHLAKSGARVLALEQFHHGHTLGSSHGESRIIRLIYDKQFYTKLMQTAYAEWRDLQSVSGKQLLFITGSVSFSIGGSQYEHTMREVLDETGIASEWWDTKHMQSRFPQFCLPKDTEILWQKDTGFLHTSACISVHLQLAKKHGATIREKTAVTAIDWDGDTPIVHTKDARFRGKKIIITAGAWTNTLLAETNLPLTVTKQQVCYYQPKDTALFQPKCFPIFSEAPTDGGFLYGIPAFGDFKLGRGVKIGHHKRGKPISGKNSPSTCDRTPDSDFTAHIDKYLRERIPALGKAAHSEICLYTETPDEDFIIDTHPHCSNLLIAAGFSGHGFKFCSLVGRIMSELALTGDTAFDLLPFRMNRQSLF